MPRPYTTDRTRWKNCDHPRTPENTYANSGKETCLTCKRGLGGDTRRLADYRPLPLPPRGDEAPELHSGRSYPFPVKSQRVS